MILYLIIIKTKYFSRCTNRHMKRCSTSLILRGMQIKTTVRHYLTPSQNGYHYKDWNAEEGVEKREPSLHCWWECKLVQPLQKTVWSFLYKMKIELPYDTAIPFLGIYLDKTPIQKDTCSDFPGRPGVKIHLAMQGKWVQSPVREQRSHRPQDH